MKRKQAQRQKSGAAKLRNKKMKQILLGVKPIEKTCLWNAAKCQRRALSGFITYHALLVARRILKERKEEERLRKEGKK